MTDQIVDILKQPEPNLVDLNSFDDEQLDAVVIYLATLVRPCLAKHGGMTTEQNKNALSKFTKIMNSWPDEFRDRLNARVVEAGRADNNFWAKPADAVISATKAVELA
jgi:hypothetical protein